MRTEYSIKNSLTQFFNNVVGFVAIFVCHTIFVKTLGLEYNGLNGLFNNMFVLLNLFELGIGNSIIFNLYKYVKENDKKTIMSLMGYYKSAYYLISIVILLFGCFLIPFLHFFIKVSVSVNIYFVYVLFLVSTISTYIANYKRNLLIASQKLYIVNIVNLIFTVILNIVQILILLTTKNYYLYLFIKIVTNISENITLNIIVNKLYPFMKSNKFDKISYSLKINIINRVKALFLHKVSSAVTNGTDNILISSILGISTLGLFTNYSYITGSVKKIFSNVISATTSSVGNLLTENNLKRNYIVFRRIQLVNYWVAIFTSTAILLVTQPFIRLWLGEKYLLNFSILVFLVINYFQTIMRSTYMSFKDAAGIWVEDKYIPVLQIVINLVSSIVLAIFFGLKGIVIGTIISSSVLWFYSYPFLVYKRLFAKPVFDYFKNLCFHAIIFAIISTFSYFLYSFHQNLFFALIISVLVPNFVLFIIYYRTPEFKYFLGLFKETIKRKI